MSLQQQIESNYNLKVTRIVDLHIPVNDVFKVFTKRNTFALKLYNVKTRKKEDVTWELELLLYVSEMAVPIAKPVEGVEGFLQTFQHEGQNRVGILFEWVAGNKPLPTKESYELLGKAAAKIHTATDLYRPKISRDNYNAELLIDDQLERMDAHLKDAQRWKQMHGMCNRLRERITQPGLDYGVCHMDLTFDNAHLADNELTVFDFDSAGTSWRAIEPYKVRIKSEEFFNSWLKGYRSVRFFSKSDEAVVSTFAIVGSIRVVAWDLGVAESSRGMPKLAANGLTKVVDSWLAFEKANIDV